MRHIILISGKDSLATALLQTAYQPSLPYEYLFSDTGCELPDVYDWLDRVSTQTGWQIIRVTDSLEARIRAYHGFLPQANARYCTIESKIQPFENWLGSDEATVYYGLRADEDRVGYLPIRKAKINPSYPLRRRDQGGITPNGIDIGGVLSILQAQDLLPPNFFWQRLYDAVSSHLSQIDGWEESLSKWEWRSLFAGRTRANCYFCFYQQLVELLWLYEAHPDYYWRMASFERTSEERTQGKSKAARARSVSQLELLQVEAAPKTFSWKQNLTLQEFADSSTHRANVFDRHVKKISSLILERVTGRNLGLISDSEISFASCGLLCGK